MYSDEVQQVLDDDEITVGDRIRITRNDSSHSGILMPRASQGDMDVIVLKLDSGYNLGVTYDEDTTIEVVEHREPEDAETRKPPEHDPDRPDITILHTGGTIASRVSYEEGGVKPAFEPEELLDIYPELFDEANVESTIISQMFSEDMEPQHWQEIAEAVANHRENADGIIIGHGTDTMHYTAAALSFMLENIDIPVVLVGSQRSSDRPSSDAAFNLFSAIRFIKEDVPGVYVCMHETMSDTTATLHNGTAVRKMHTSRRDTFESIDRTPVARVNPETDNVELLDVPETGTDGEFKLRTELDTQVGLLQTQPGLDPELLSFYTDNEYRGLVVSGTGLGHLPVNVLDEHTEHHEDILNAVDAMTDDMVVAMSSQCINGRVNMNVYDSGVKLQHAGVLTAENMTPEAAYVKLMWALGQTDTIEEAEALFQENVAGELIPRETFDVR